MPTLKSPIVSRFEPDEARQQEGRVVGRAGVARALDLDGDELGLDALSPRLGDQVRLLDDLGRGLALGHQVGVHPQPVAVPGPLQLGGGLAAAPAGLGLVRPTAGGP